MQSDQRRPVPARRGRQPPKLDASLLLLLLPPLAFLLIFMVMPMAGLFRASFSEGDRALDIFGFSFQHYSRLLFDSYYLGVIGETVGLGLVSAIVSLLLGFPVGYSLARLQPSKRRWRLIIVILPLTLSLVVVVFGWLVVLGRNGMLNSILMGAGIYETPQRLLFNRTAVLVVIVQQFLPFMILSVMSVVTQIDPVLEQASANLRANRFTTFRKVIIPLAMPGILAGFTLVFILSVSAFITPRMVGGARVQMLGSLIYEQVTSLLNWPFGSAMSFVLLIITLSMTVFVNMAVAIRLTSKQNAHAQ
jgi:putative spermidine/putrescine transport system permease protein